MGNDKKLDCKYGAKCYQKNQSHHDKYNHPFQLDLENSNAAGKRQKSPSFCSSEETSPKRPKGTPSKETETETETDANQLKKSRSESRQDSRQKSPLPDPLDLSEKDNEITKKRDGESTSKDKSDSEMQKIIPSGSTNQENLKDGEDQEYEKTYNEVMRNLGKKNYFELYQKRMQFSKKVEYQDLLKTPEFIRHKFMVEMPPDFYKFWEFCKSIAKDGQKPEKVFEKVGLKLVGPFDYLAGKFNQAEICEPGDYLRHWRFYYDPPEFQTIFVLGGTAAHFGYWRDHPKDKEDLLVARNDSKESCEFEFVGGNCFEGVMYFLENDAVRTPFTLPEINNMKKKLQTFAKDHEISMNSLEALKKKRGKHVVCRTFHKAGLVAQVDKDTKVGYRNLIESDASLKKVLLKLGNSKGNKKIISDVMERLQGVVTAANIAVDECDFTTSVELGIDLFCSGYPELHALVQQMLINGYSMLQKPQFIAIMKAHLENREKGIELSMLK